MTTSKHTPGPWAIGRKVSNMVYGRDGLDIICQCDTMGEESRHVENANAKLIAAAPDLVAVLQALLLKVSGDNRAQASDVLVEIAQRVLVKAGV